MIGKITDPRGERVEGLVYYLYGPGRREEHTDPHIVAGRRHPAELEPPLREDGKRDFRRLLGLLNQPHAAMGKWGFRRPVWHCSMRAAPGDKMLSDDEWAQIACEVLAVARGRHRDEPLGAVRGRVHGPEAAVEAEVAGGHDHQDAVGLRAESEKAARRGLAEPPRVTLRRHVSTAAAGAGNEQEFFARLAQAGVLVRSRLSARNPGQITGYAVALPGDTAKDGSPVWYGGGKLAADLTWPKIRQRWNQADSIPGDRFTPVERNAIWEHAARAADNAAAQIRLLAGSDPAAAADAAWAAGDTLHVAAAALGSHILRQAADAYDRAARAPYGRIPRPSPAGNRLRQAARLISAFAFVSDDHSLSQITLITRLAALAEAVCVLRHSQQRAAQAASALTAAQRLHAAVGAPVGPARREHAPAQSAAALADAGFPVPSRRFPADSSAAGRRRPGPAGPQPSPRRGRQPQH